MKMLDLFAGIGGASLSAHRFGIETTQFVEIDPAAQKVLRHHFPHIPIHSDICTYEPAFQEAEIIWVSFPCKGSSNAGKRNGLAHPETALWWEAWRIIQAVRPQFAIVEQPDGIRFRGLSEILRCFAKIGYVGEWKTVSASELGAPHRRERVFVIAYANDLPSWERQNWSGWKEHIREEVKTAFSNSYRCDGGRYSQRYDFPASNQYGKLSQNLKEERQGRKRGTSKISQAAAYTSSERLQRAHGELEQFGFQNDHSDSSRRECQPTSLGMDDGISPELVRGSFDGVPDWLNGINFGGWWQNNPPPQRAGIEGKNIPGRRDCIRLYGNAVTPQQAAVVFRRVLEIAK